MHRKVAHPIGYTVYYTMYSIHQKCEAIQVPFHCHRQMAYAYLDVTVWDFCSTTADDFIGEVLIKLSEANLTDELNLYELGTLTYEERLKELAEMTTEGDVKVFLKANKRQMNISIILQLILRMVNIAAFMGVT